MMPFSKGTTFMNKMVSILIFCILVITPQIMALDTDGLVGAWLMDDNTGETVRDSSDNKLHGKFARGNPQWVPGNFGKALKFGGAEMVTVPHNDLLNLSSFTIAAWINSPNTTGIWHIIASKELRNPTGRNYGIFGHLNNGSIHYSFTSGGWKSFDAPTNVTDGTWHHVAAAYAKPDFKLYVDGKLDSQNSPNADPESNSNPLYIGGCDIGKYWMTGSIDEVVLYNRALDENEINELMTKSY